MFWNSAEAVVIAFCCKAYNYIVQKLPITRSAIFYGVSIMSNYLNNATSSKRVILEKAKRR